MALSMSSVEFWPAQTKRHCLRKNSSRRLPRVSHTLSGFPLLSRATKCWLSSELVTTLGNKRGKHSPWPSICSSELMRFTINIIEKWTLPKPLWQWPCFSQTVSAGLDHNCYQLRLSHSTTKETRPGSQPLSSAENSTRTWLQCRPSSGSQFCLWLLPAAQCAQWWVWMLTRAKTHSCMLSSSRMLKTSEATLARRRVESLLQICWR
jgi:hypothetical protein